jgi:SulP family sulfate permease
VGGRVYVSGLAPELVEQAKRTGTVADDGPAKLYRATSVIGESSLDAFHDAQAWVAAQPPDGDA